MFKTRHRERLTGARRSRSLARLWITSSLMLLAMTILCFSPAALAETKEEAEELQAILDDAAEKIKEQQSPITRYAPEHCDFEITFPEEPYTSKRCPEGVGKCYGLTGYTMVYDLSTTVDVTVTCVPSTPANYNRYNERVIKAALGGMVKRAGINEFKIHTVERENTRQGSLIGSGTYGKQNKIYNAQLWIGQNSVFTMEAKLVGRKHIEADATFSEILKSIQVKE